MNQLTAAAAPTSQVRLRSERTTGIKLTHTQSRSLAYGPVPTAKAAKFRVQALRPEA